MSPVDFRATTRTLSDRSAAKIHYPKYCERARLSLAALVSRAYSGRLRWFLDSQKWHELEIAASDIRRKAILVPETGAVYIAISKAANTSLSYILSDKKGVTESNVHKKRFAPSRLVDSGQTLSDLTIGTRPIFTFVRHPIARFWSAYRDKIVNAQNSPPSRRKQRRTNLLAGLSTPEDVIRYLIRTPPLEIEEHFRPQWSCAAVEHLPMTYIGKVETMKTDIESLIEQGLITRTRAARLPRLNTTGSTSHPNREEIDTALRDIYRKDFELFGYS